MPLSAVPESRQPFKLVMRQSLVNDYLLCAKSFEFRHIRGHQEAQRLDPLEGTVMHRALEILNRVYCAEQRWMSASDLIDVFQAEWKERRKTFEVAEEDYQTIEKRGVWWLTEYVEKHAKMNVPAGPEWIEKTVSGTIAGRPAQGTIDLVVEDAQEGEEKGLSSKIILDYKVVSAAKSEHEAKLGTQFGMYSLMTGIKRVRYVCFKKTKTPQIAVIDEIRTDATNEKTKRVLAQVADSIDKGAFPYADPTSWKCCEKFCGFWHMCENGGK